MNKRDKIDQILALVKEQTDEFIDIEDMTGMTELTAEELVVAAIEIVTSHAVTTIEYTSPVATVDRSNMSFMLDEQIEIPIYKSEEEVTDDEDSLF
jgi:hypothetical protein